MGCVGVRCYIYCSFIDLETNLQVQGSSKAWHHAYNASIKKATPAIYYSGALHAGRVILRQEGLTGLYAGYALDTLEAKHW